MPDSDLGSEEAGRDLQRELESCDRILPWTILRQAQDLFRDWRRDSIERIRMPDSDLGSEEAGRDLQRELESCDRILPRVWKVCLMKKKKPHLILLALSFLTVAVVFYFLIKRNNLKPDFIYTRFRQSPEFQQPC